MPEYRISVSGFSDAYLALNREGTHPVSRGKFLKYATTVGNAHFSPAFRRTQTALALALYRAMAVRCVIDFDQSRLRPFPEYRRLEKSEKANLAYWIGMSMAAIVANDILGVSNTFHAQQLEGQLVRHNDRSKSLLDLLGQDSTGAWHALEAKGRQRSPSVGDGGKWKTQAGTVHSVNQDPIATRSYCVTLIQDPLRVELVDPPAENDSPRDLKVDLEAATDGYYRPFVDFLKPQRIKLPIRDRVLLIRPVSFDPIDQDYVYLGIDHDYYQYFHSDETQKLFPKAKDEFEDERVYVGSDGVAVVTSPTPCDFSE